MAAIPTIGLLAGSAFGLLVPDLPRPVAFALLALGVGGAAWSWRGARPLFLASAVGLSFFAGGAVLSIDAWQAAWRPTMRTAFEELARQQREEAALSGRSLPEDDSAFAIVTGVVRADASPRPNGVSLSLDVTSIAGRPDSSGASELRPVRGGVLLAVSGSLALERVDEWRAGRIVRVPAQLGRPSRYLNPGVPDEERSLARRGTTLVGSVKSGILVEVAAKGGWLPETAAAARSFARRAIASAVGRWSARSAGVVTAIIIGDRAGLDQEVQRRLQEAGTYHVIAISGGNIAILAGLTLVGFRVAGMLGRAAMLSAIVALLAYGYLIGGGASVNRATLMAVVYFAARSIDLRGPPTNVLALAAGLLVAAQPMAIIDPGFLLTFGATVAIVVAVPVVPIRSLPRLLMPVGAMLCASVAAEAVLLPISAFIFSRVTFAGLLLNFAAIPLMGVVQIAGIVVVVAAAVSSTLASAAGWAAHIAAEGLVRSADLVTFLPVLTWRVAPPHWFVVAAYYCGLVVGWALWRFRVQRLGSAEGLRRSVIRRSAVTAAVVSGIWIVAEPWIALRQSGDGRLRVTFVDVGQGDAALVQFPSGTAMLVDAGGLTGTSSFDIGDRVVAPVLRHAGIRRLDAVAVTHGDLDHAGGAASIVREFRPRDVWEGIPVPRLQLLRDLRAAAGASGARWANVQAGDLIAIDDVQIAVRHPRLPDWERQDVRNDDSIVLELVWRDVSIVLTGDIGREVEREIAPLFPPSRLRVVKVPHHGSLTSSSRDFVRALAPRVAVVSVGRGNPFGHPAPAVLDTYRELGAHIFRTDQDGAVTVDTDGHSLDVSTFTGQRVFTRQMQPRYLRVTGRQSGIARELQCADPGPGNSTYRIVKRSISWSSCLRRGIRRDPDTFT